DTTESARTSIGLPPGRRRSGTWENIEMGDTPGNGAGAGKDIRRPDRALTADDGKAVPHDDALHNEVPRHVQSLQSFHSQTFASFPSANGNNSSAHGPQGGDGGGGGDAQEELAWGPAHPCFPHMNVHVPVDSLDYANTRIIRIRRSYMVEGDVAPTFSNLYPE